MITGWRDNRVMTVELKPEQSQVIAEAIQAGLIKSADEALDIAVDVLRARLKASAPQMDAEEWMRRFRSLGSSLPPDTPLLSDEARSRESIYRERGL